jgi:hypothetical protein
MNQLQIAPDPTVYVDNFSEIPDVENIPTAIGKLLGAGGLVWLDLLPFDIAGNLGLVRLPTKDDRESRVVSLNAPIRNLEKFRGVDEKIRNTVRWSLGNGNQITVDEIWPVGCYRTTMKQPKSPKLTLPYVVELGLPSSELPDSSQFCNQTGGTVFWLPFGEAVSLLQDEIADSANSTPKNAIRILQILHRVYESDPELLIPDYAAI